jgi:signal transduction histidine kinase/ActR/RegA family two-component response regulator
MRSGRTECLTASDLQAAAQSARSGANADDATQSTHSPETQAAVVLPLVARGRVLGTLTLARLRDSRPYSAAEISLAEDLAGRIALAIDNANLVRKIQEGDRRKDEFLATLSHELRNPLAAISNALQCMELAADSPAVVDEARTILRRQIQYVVRLVEDLLDVSRITRGKIRLRKEIVELRPIVERAASAVAPLIADRRHQFSMSFPAQPVYLNGDATRLEQAVGNLLNNAAKYTSTGGRIGLVVESDGKQAAIRVQDSGAGIPADVLPKIFDLFAQGDRTLDHSQGGLGIGLTLVRSLIALHGGEVEATSPGPGQGSEFTIRLPLGAELKREQPLEPAPPGNGSPQHVALSRRRILLVDDNVDLATMTGALLRSLGHEVSLAHDGPDALRAIEVVHPEVAFVDIGLPGMSGHEIAQAIRRRPGGAQLLLVAMTGYGQAEDRRRSRDAGFDLHLVKPVGLQALQNVLDSTPIRQPQSA